MKAIKIQCPKCREISPMEFFATSDQGLHFRCAECGETVFVENADNLGDRPLSAAASGSPDRDPTATPPGGPPDDGGVDCPKCGHHQPGGDTCHHCGLNFRRFDPGNLPPDPVEAKAIWDRLQARPEDTELHEQFVQTCNQLGRLDYAAKCYRQRERHPAWQDVVGVMRVRLLSLAQAQLAPTALGEDGREKIKTRSRIFIWVLLILALSGFSFLVYYSSDLLDKL